MPPLTLKNPRDAQGAESMLVQPLGAEEVWEGATHGGRRVLLDDEVEREETENDRDLRAQKGRSSHLKHIADRLQRHKVQKHMGIELLVSVT